MLKALTIFNRERVSQASSGQSESCRNLQTAGTSASQDSETGTNKGASQSVWAALNTCEVGKNSERISLKLPVKRHKLTFNYTCF